MNHPGESVSGSATGQSQPNGHQPLFSIVLPVFDVVDFLPACIDSILGQSNPDFEIVAVDDASTDGSAAVLDSYGARDPRLTTVHLASNVGLGGARNIGIERARGAYLLFADADDLLADAALDAVADRIARTGSPDVVLFGFARTYADGTVVADVSARWLAPAAVLRARERPELLEVFPSAWNKAYRRTYVLEHGFRFPDGYYEDLAWTYPVLMTADPLATLDRVCYLYRQRATGNILSTSGQGHLDLFAQYERVFAYLDSHTELEWWRPRLVDRITRHVPAVLEEAGRIPSGLRREFFHTASAAFRQHRPRGYLPSGGVGAKLKVLLIERDGYRLFRAAQLANALIRKVRRSRP